jgi:hypothetical protein
LHPLNSVWSFSLKSAGEAGMMGWRHLPSLSQFYANRVSIRMCLLRIWPVQYFVAATLVIGASSFFDGLPFGEPFLAVSQLLADDPPGVRLPLFNGRDLAGWTEINCRAGVEEGVLVIQDGDGLLRTDHRYDDFILELEWRARKSEKYDSGIYLRCEPPAAGEKFPKQYQVNLQQAFEGNLIGSTDGQSQGLVKPGEWNHFRITAIGETIELEINGQPAWEATGIDAAPGYIGLQVETPLGGQFEFRDLYVTELRARSLFNGRDLSGWEGAGEDAGACWRVEEELLVCTGDKGPWLRSQEQVEDFNLRLEYLLKPGGNSGVYVRVPEDGNHHGPGAGVEIQILDDADERYRDLAPYQYSASVYGIAPAEPHVSRPNGQWNTLEIDCLGLAYRVTHNGVVVADADVTAFPLLQERQTKGWLGLQNHSERVAFRNVRLSPSLRASR